MSSTATRAVTSCRRSSQTEAGRREWLARELARDQAENEPGDSAAAELTEGFDAERIGPNGRRGWLREAHRQLEQQRWQTAEQIPRSRADRLRLAAGWLEDELAAECRGNRLMRRCVSSGGCTTSAGSAGRRSPTRRRRSRPAR